MLEKYASLEQYLRHLSLSEEEVTLTFERIDQLLNEPLPPSARQYNAWWSSETKGSHVQAHSWMDAGWKVDEVNFSEKWVKFVRQKIIVSPS